MRGWKTSSRYEQEKYFIAERLSAIPRLVHNKNGSSKIRFNSKGDIIIQEQIQADLDRKTAKL